MVGNRLKAKNTPASRAGEHDSAGGRTNPGPADNDTAYLAELGARVRRIRAIRGMSRKVLAQTSGISERYIAQMEAGAGNVSIVLLRRIGRATGVRLEDLIGEVPDSWAAIRELLAKATPGAIAVAKDVLAGKSNTQASAQELSSIPRIALVGLRGAGKSSIGTRAAAQTGLKFVELNQEIEDQHGLSVTEIFKLYGQEGYRRLEMASLQRIIAEGEPLILATGGGIVAETATFDLLRQSFFTVWIRARPEEHMSRVRKQGDLRPMANDRAAMEELVTILTSREPLYGLADAQVDTSGRSVDECVADLVSTITAQFPASLTVLQD